MPFYAAHRGLDSTRRICRSATRAPRLAALHRCRPPCCLHLLRSATSCGSPFCRLTILPPRRRSAACAHAASHLPRIVLSHRSPATPRYPTPFRVFLPAVSAAAVSVSDCDIVLPHLHTLPTFLHHSCNVNLPPHLPALRTCCVSTPPRTCCVACRLDSTVTRVHWNYLHASAPAGFLLGGSCRIRVHLRTGERFGYTSVLHLAGHRGLHYHTARTCDICQLLPQTFRAFCVC